MTAKKAKPGEIKGTTDHLLIFDEMSDGRSQEIYDFFKEYPPGVNERLLYRPVATSWNDHSHGLPQQNITEKALRDAYRNLPRLNPNLRDRIEEWTRQDPRVDQFWRIMTGRIEQRHSSGSGANDMVDGMMSALSHLLAQWDRERDQLNTRNLDNIRTLGEAANFVVGAFDDAKSRGDLDYMEAAIEELDSALHDVKYGEDR